MAEPGAHIASRRTYYVIYVTLLICTYITWQVAYFDLGALNTVAALAIAFVKAGLVALFFMHVKDSPRLIWAVVVGGVFWLMLLLGLTMSDYATRSFLSY